MIEGRTADRADDGDHRLGDTARCHQAAHTLRSLDVQISQQVEPCRQCVVRLRRIVLRRIGDHPLQITRDVLRHRRVVRLQATGRHHHQRQSVDRYAVQGRPNGTGHQIAKWQFVERHRQHRLVRSRRMECGDLARDALRAELQVGHQTVVGHDHLRQRHLVEARHVAASDILQADAFGAAGQRGLQCRCRGGLRSWGCQQEPNG